MSQILKTSKAFRDCLLPLTKSERDELAKQIADAGRVIDPIITWNGGIIDGRNRYEIATDLGVPFTTKAMTFESETHALIWVMEHQVGRRNVESDQRENLALALFESYNKTGYGGKAMLRVCALFGKPESTIKRWMKSSDARRKIHPDITKDVKAGKVTLSAGDTQALATQTIKEQKKTVATAKKKKCTVRAVVDAAKLTAEKEPPKKTSGSTTPADDEPAATDMRGKQLPPAFRSAFESTGYDEAQHYIKEILRIAKRQLARGPKGAWLMLDSVVEHCEKLEFQIRRATPFAVCPKCEGSKCKLCRETGFVPQYVVVDFESRTK